MATLPDPGSADGPERIPARWAAAAAALGLVLAVPVATWWLVGDLSTVPVSAGRDYGVCPAFGSVALSVVTVRGVS